MNYAYYAHISLVVIVVVAAMTLVWMVIDIQTSRILSSRYKGRLFSKNIAQRLIVISEKKEKELNAQLKTTNSNLSAREFYFRTIFMALASSGLVLLATSIYMPGFSSIAMTVLTVAFSIYHPISQLKNKIKYNELRKSIELPRFLKNLTTLLRTQTPYDAVRESIRYAPPTIKPHAEMLLIEITQYPKSSIPYENFAKNLGLKQAKQFMNLLYQSLDISQKSSRNFIEKLNQMTDNLENEAAKTLSLLEAKSMSKYSYITLGSVVCLPLALALVTMMEILKNFN